jgi:hypothetical protein
MFEPWHWPAGTLTPTEKVTASPTCLKAPFKMAIVPPLPLPPQPGGTWSARTVDGENAVIPIAMSAADADAIALRRVT